MKNNWIDSSFAKLKKSAIINYTMPNAVGNVDVNALIFLYYRTDLDEYKAFLNFTNQNPLLSHEISIEQIKQYAKNSMNINSQASLEDMLHFMVVQKEKRILEQNIAQDYNNKKVNKL